MTHDQAPNGAAYRAGVVTGTAVRLLAPTLGVLVAGLLIASNFAPGRLKTSMVVTGGLLNVALIVVIARFSRSWFWGFIAAYVLFVIAGVVIADSEQPNRVALGVVAAGTIATAAGGILVAIRAGRRSKELERLLFSESTSIAFFATMLAAVTYGLLESWFDAPVMSAWMFWSIGMASWFIASFVARRRYD